MKSKENHEICDGRLDLKKALDAVDGDMLILKASKSFKILRTIIICKQKEIYPKECRKGPPTNLTPDEGIS